jgi:hypothetical protein
MGDTAIEYRGYIIGSDGHIASCRTYVCKRDADALVWAEQLVAEGHTVELWSGERFVVKLENKAR